jgi:Fe-S cluster assembly ATPase SufC
MSRKSKSGKSPASNHREPGITSMKKGRREVLLFDEPTAGVDVENQAVIEELIREIRRGIRGSPSYFPPTSVWKQPGLLKTRSSYLKVN